MIYIFFHFQMVRYFLLKFDEIGNYEGIGRIREKELYLSAKYLGFKKVELAFNGSLLDGPKENWP